LEDASGAPVRDIMNTFILQGGHPLVTLDDGELDQQPFAYGPVPPGTESAIGTRWNVPVAVRALPHRDTPGAPVRRLVLGAEPAPVPEVAQGIVVVNAGGWGVFRVGYQAEHRLALAEHLPELTPLERANLMGDTWATTLAGHTRFDGFIRLAMKLGVEPDPGAWAPVGSALFLCNRIAGSEDRAALRDAVMALIGPLHRRLGFEALPGEGERTPTLRALAINLLGTVGADETIRAEAARRFDASPIAGGSEPIPADIEVAVLAVVAQLLRPGDYDTVLARYRAATTPQEEMRSLGALASFPDVELCLRTFDLAMTEVRSQNGFAVLSALLANPVGCQAIWNRITEQWDAILERFPKNAPVRILESISALCGDAEFAQAAIAFLRSHPVSSGPRRVAQSIERLEVNVAFAARERPQLAQVLATATQPS
jgi:puromycin-sensitive aminopeptidase